MTPIYVWSKEEAEIVKAAWADEHGRRALELIIGRVCNLMGQSFETDPHATAFNEGRRYVGIALKNAINTPMNKLVRTDDDNRSSGPVATATERAAAVAVSQPAAASTGTRRKR